MTFATPNDQHTTPASVRRRRYWIGLFALASLVAYLGTGFYVVDADKHAVVRRFGAVEARMGPGMHYRVPWPVDQVDVLKTTSVMKIGVGFKLAESESEIATGVELLTGDTNILGIALVVQYVIEKTDLINPNPFISKTAIAGKNTVFNAVV